MKNPAKKSPRKNRKNYEIRFYEELLKIRPNFIEALNCLGEVYTRRGFYHEGLKIDLQLRDLKPDDPIVYYNLACSYSLLGDIKSSMAAFKKAVLLGYEDFSWMRKDKDLINLRKSREFAEFLEKLDL